MLTRPELLGIASVCDHEPMVSLMVRAMWLPGPSWGQKPVPRAEVTRSGGGWHMYTRRQHRAKFENSEKMIHQPPGARQQPGLPHKEASGEA